MKKLLSLITVLALVITLNTGSLLADASDYSNQTTITSPYAGKGNGNKNKNQQVTTPVVNAPLYGVLDIPAVGISVPLYNSNEQSVCDAKDAACYFQYKTNSGMMVVDHNYQTFITLPNVKIGTTATITASNGAKIYLVCKDITTGHNTLHGLLDNAENPFNQIYDLLTYTCMDSTYNVLICQWDIEAVSNINLEYESNFKIDNRTLLKLAALSNAQETNTEEEKAVELTEEIITEVPSEEETKVETIEVAEPEVSPYEQSIEEETSEPSIESYSESPDDENVKTSAPEKKNNKNKGKGKNK